MTAWKNVCRLCANARNAIEVRFTFRHCGDYDPTSPQVQSRHGESNGGIIVRRGRSTRRREVSATLGRRSSAAWLGRERAPMGHGKGWCSIEKWATIWFV